jgi:hypothetical protein
MLIKARLREQVIEELTRNVAKGYRGLWCDTVRIQCVKRWLGPKFAKGTMVATIDTITITQLI